MEHLLWEDRGDQSGTLTVPAVQMAGVGICSTRLLPEKPTYHFTPPGNEGMFSGKEPFSKDMLFSKHQLLRGGIVS